MRAAFVLFAGWLALAAADANPYAGGVAPTHGEQTLKKQDPSSPQGGGRALMTYSGPVLQVMPSPYTSTNPGIGYVCQYYIGSGAGLEWVDIDRHPKKTARFFLPTSPSLPPCLRFPPSANIAAFGYLVGYCAAAAGYTSSTQIAGAAIAWTSAITTSTTTLQFLFSWLPSGSSYTSCPTSSSTGWFLSSETRGTTYADYVYNIGGLPSNYLFSCFTLNPTTYGRSWVATNVGIAVFDTCGMDTFGVVPTSQAACFALGSSCGWCAASSTCGIVSYSSSCALSALGGSCAGPIVTRTTCTPTSTPTVDVAAGLATGIIM